MVGQPEAVAAAAAAVQRAAAGLHGRRRPMASLLLCGPPGTGKTLLATVGALNPGPRPKI